MDKERANAGWILGRVKQRIRSGLGLIPTEERTPFAPPATGNDAAVVLNNEVGVIINQLGVDAENVASDGVSLLRRVVPDTQSAAGGFNELAKSVNVGLLGHTKFHCGNT